MADSSKAVSVPNIDLSGESILNMILRKARGKDVKLKICKLSEFELNQLRYVLYILNSDLIKKGDTKTIIFYTC